MHSKIERRDRKSNDRRDGPTAPEPLERQRGIVADMGEFRGNTGSRARRAGANTVVLVLIVIALAFVGLWIRSLRVCESVVFTFGPFLVQLASYDGIVHAMVAGDCRPFSEGPRHYVTRRANRGPASGFRRATLGFGAEGGRVSYVGTPRDLRYVLIRCPDWLVVMVLGYVPLACLLRRLRERRRERRGQCARCGYDQRATSGSCPECGVVRAARTRFV